MQSRSPAAAFQLHYLGGAPLPVPLGRHGRIEVVRAGNGPREPLVVEVRLPDGSHVSLDLRPRNDNLHCAARTNSLNVSFRSSLAVPSISHGKLARAFVRHMTQVELDHGPPPLEAIFPGLRVGQAPDPERKQHRLELIIFPTDACNLRCTYCIVPFGKAVLSPAHVARAFELTRRAELDSMNATFLGGEPMIGWDCITDVTARMRERWAKPGLAMVTNGTLIDPERAAFLAQHNFSVTVSVDGIEASHATERLAKGNVDDALARQLFRKTMKGLQLMLETPLEIKANMVVTPRTVDRMLDGARFLMDSGVSLFTISPAVGVEWGDAGLQQLRRGLEDYADWMLGWLRGQSDLQRARVRRVLEWEIRRSWYFMGQGVFNPHTRRIVLGPDGRLFSDLYNDDTAELLYLGHLDEIDGWCDLPELAKTVPQAMFERRAWSERVLHDVMGLSRHLMEVLIDLDAAAFTNEPGAPELVGHVPTRADLADLDRRIRGEVAQNSG